VDGGAEREPARYRPLLIGSLALMVAGVLVIAAVAVGAEGAMSDILAGGRAERAATVLTLLMVGGMALLVGLLAHAARSVVVRETLSAERYRGPSVLVMLVIALVAANLAIVPAAGDVAALLDGGELSPLGTLAVLTVTQLALLGIAALYVAAPRALVGLRLLPERGLWRSVGLGLALSLPAWIAAQLIGVVVLLILERFGLAPDVGVAERALANADPVVLVVAIVGVAPVAEELFFRGVVYNAWLREYGPRAAILGSALLFAVIHASLFLLLPIVGLGIALALLYRATGSLPATIALHAGFNGLTLLIALLDRYGVLDLPVV
jgi:membrane protease YdiL (CAAX protease family)